MFSSSAGVYGTPDAERVTEATPHRPESPYGASKSMGEWVIDDTVAAVDGMRGVSLRYFNVVGSGHPDVWDVSPHNLFPLVMRRLVAGEVPAVNGTDYPTPDGSCVRDYVHVSDVALAHVEAATAQEEGRALASAYNLGSGDGLSVLQIMDAFRRRDRGRLRAGDPRSAARRPRADRGRRQRSGSRHRLGDAPLRRRHGHLGLGQLAQGRLRLTAAAPRRPAVPDARTRRDVQGVGNNGRDRIG